MKFANIIYNAGSVEELAEVISDGGTSDATPPELVAQYIVSTQEESGYEHSRAAWVAHLDCLLNAGASGFPMDEVWWLAEKYAKANA